jgi:hypothetical protein
MAGFKWDCYLKCRHLTQLKCACWPRLSAWSIYPSSWGVLLSWNIESRFLHNIGFVLIRYIYACIVYVYIYIYMRVINHFHIGAWRSRKGEHTAVSMLWRSPAAVWGWPVDRSPSHLGGLFFCHFSVTKATPPMEVKTSYLTKQGRFGMWYISETVSSSLQSLLRTELDTRGTILNKM